MLLLFFMCFFFPGFQFLPSDEFKRPSKYFWQIYVQELPDTEDGITESNTTFDIESWDSNETKRADSISKEPDKNEIMKPDLLQSEVPNKVEDDAEEYISVPSLTGTTPSVELLTETISGRPTLTPERANQTVGMKIDEVISLPRGRCNMDIHVHEAEDKKFKMQFGLLEKNSVGQCQISLYGDDEVMLAVLITELRLYQASNSCKSDETLRVVTTNTGINFTIKQYCGDEDHYPVILTETNRAYVMLSYNRTGLIEPLEESSFSLEVFSYLKHENHIDKPTHAQQSSHKYPESISGQNVDHIYFTTVTPEP